MQHPVPQPQPELEKQIADVLHASEYALRVVDIVRQLSEKCQVTADAKTVNGLLYRNKTLFEKAPGTGTPMWRANEVPVAPRLAANEGEVVFHIDEFGSVSLRADMPPEKVESLLSFIATLIPPETAKVFRHSGSAAARKIGDLAAKSGFAVEMAAPK